MNHHVIPHTKFAIRLLVYFIVVFGFNNCSNRNCANEKESTIDGRCARNKAQSLSDVFFEVLEDQRNHVHTNSSYTSYFYIYSQQYENDERKYTIETDTITTLSEFILNHSNTRTHFLCFINNDEIYYKSVLSNPTLIRIALDESQVTEVRFINEISNESNDFIRNQNYFIILRREFLSDSNNIELVQSILDYSESKNSDILNYASMSVHGKSYSNLEAEQRNSISKSFGSHYIFVLSDGKTSICEQNDFQPQKLNN